MVRCLTFLFFVTASGLAQPSAGFQNLDFETGTTGITPPNWLIATPGLSAKLTEDGARTGRCVHLVRTGDGPAPFGNLMQTIAGDQLQNKRIRIEAWVRVKSGSPEDVARLWVREDLANGQMGLFDNMGNRPIRSKEWTKVEIEGALHETGRLNLGLMLFGQAEAWLDDVTFEVLGDVEVARRTPPRTIDERGLRNLTAFTRLLGYVRFFHPSDQVADLDWERFAVLGCEVVEPATTDIELIARMEHLFAPYAPTVHIANWPEESVPEKATRVARWRHNGIGLGPQSMYSSRRTFRGLDDDTSNQRVIVDLVDGLQAAVPLRVYADADGTLPKPSAAPLEFSTAELSADDRTVRLATVALGWTIFQHFYPYFDVVQTDWDSALTVALQAAAEDADACAFANTLRKLVAKLQDGHGFVVHTCVMSRAHPPLQVAWIEDQLVVVDTEAGAEQIKVGTIITQIDGQPTAKRAAEVDQLISASTPQFKRWRSASEMLTGVPGSEAKLTVTFDGEQRIETVRRTSHAKQPARSGEIVRALEPGIWYVDLDRLDAATLRKNIDTLAEAKGVILDMRGYPNKQGAWQIMNHLSEQSMTCAQWHVPNPKVPDRKDMNYQFSNWPVQPKQPQLDGKLVFLIDGRAISAAETLMGIVEHYKLGEIVGEATAGTNGNINPFELPGGFRIIWTGMRVLKHDGSQHHGIGILPTIPVQRTIAGVVAGRDEVLERALEVVQSTGSESAPD